MKKKTFWSSIPLYIKWILVSAIIVIIALIGAYPYFVGMKISKEPVNWGLFGEYYGSIVATTNTVAIVFLGYLVYKSQNKRDDWERYYMAAQEKPLLRFVAWEGKSYRLYNMGKGPAHKIIVGKIESDKTDITKPTYKGYSIPSNAYLDVDWSTASSSLYAYYEGELNELYLVKCSNDENIDIEKGKERDEIEAFLKNNAIRKDKITIHSF